MARQDYLLDESNDLLIQNGDFVVGDSNEQHIADIGLDSPGDWRLDPTVGFNAVRYRNVDATKKQQFVSEFRTQLANDGYSNINIDVSMAEWWKSFNVTFEDD